MPLSCSMSAPFAPANRACVAIVKLKQLVALAERYARSGLVDRQAGRSASRTRELRSEVY